MPRAPPAGGKRETFERTATLPMRQLIADAASAFGIPEGDVLLISGEMVPCSLAGALAHKRAVDAGFVGDVEALCSPPPTRIIVRFVTEGAAAPSE
jgi:hypothetical protein